MDQLVLFQVTSPSKSLAANITNMILLSCMNQLVLFQVTTLSESLAANITHMILLSCMNQLVLFQVTGLGKSLVAHITHMFVAGHGSTLMTVGWAWLGSRVCLAKIYWHRVLFIFFFCLKHKIK
jgi:hypothetical protein